jgi:hypothetical protein
MSPYPSPRTFPPVDVITVAINKFGDALAGSTPLGLMFISAKSLQENNITVNRIKTAVNLFFIVYILSDFKSF